VQTENDESIDVLVQELIQKLEQSGYSDDGKILKNCVDGGTTGTEILMCLHWNLKQLQRNKHPSELKRELIAIQKKIGRLIR